MIRFINIIIFLCVLFLLFNNDFNVADTTQNYSIMKAKIDTLETKIRDLEYLKQIMEEYKENVYRTYSLSIESANRTYTIVQWVLYILTGLLITFGITSFVKFHKTMKSVKNYAKNKAEGEILQAAEKVETEIKKLGIDQTNLNREFLNFNREFKRVYNLTDICNRLFELQSFEDEQLKAIAYFIEKPAKMNYVVIYFLKQLRLSENPIIRAQSMFARFRCCDEGALSDLQEMLKSEKPEIQKAAENVIEEIKNRFKNDLENINKC